MNNLPPCINFIHYLSLRAERGKFVAVQRDIAYLSLVSLTLCRHFLFPQKKVTKENSRLRLPLLLSVLLVRSVLAEPDDAGFFGERLVVRLPHKFVIARHEAIANLRS
jgi:hypothetical protein